jgi:hypothetical protein
MSEADIDAVHATRRTPDEDTLVQWFDKQRPGIGIGIVAKHGGHHDGVLPKNMWTLAAVTGHMKAVRWLRDRRVEGCTNAVFDSAAKNGHMDVVRWLHISRTEGCTKDAMDGAATNGHLEVVRWLHEHRTEGCTQRAMDGAATNGHIEVVRWLHLHRKEGFSQEAINGAAANGHLDVVRWLFDYCAEGCAKQAMHAAAQGGHLEVVCWLLDQQDIKPWVVTPKQTRRGVVRTIFNMGECVFWMMLTTWVGWCCMHPWLYGDAYVQWRYMCARDPGICGVWIFGYGLFVFLVASVWLSAVSGQLKQLRQLAQLRVLEH